MSSLKAADISVREEKLRYGRQCEISFPIPLVLIHDSKFVELPFADCAGPLCSESCRAKKHREVKAFLAMGVDPNTPNSNGPVPLLIAVQQNDFKSAKRLVDGGADPGRIGIGEKAQTPLCAAIVMGSSKLFTLLVGSKKLDPECAVSSPGEEGFTALHFAARENQVSMLNTLLEKGSNPHAVGLHRLSTPLHLAAMAKGRQQIIKDMGKYMNGRIDIPDQLGFTPLHFAAREDNHDATVALLELGASSIALFPPLSSTPLHMAAGKGHHKIVATMASQMKKSGLSLEVPDKDDNTALHVACLSGHLKAASALIRAGANPGNSRKKDGLSPIHLALQLHYSTFEPKFRKRAKSSKSFSDIYNAVKSEVEEIAAKAMGTSTDGAPKTKSNPQLAPPTVANDDDVTDTKNRRYSMFSEHDALRNGSGGGSASPPHVRPQAPVSAVGQNSGRDGSPGPQRPLTLQGEIEALHAQVQQLPEGTQKATAIAVLHAKLLIQAIQKEKENINSSQRAVAQVVFRIYVGVIEVAISIAKGSEYAGFLAALRLECLPVVQANPTAAPHLMPEAEGVQVRLNFFARLFDTIPPEPAQLATALRTWLTDGHREGQEWLQSHARGPQQEAPPSQFGAAIPQQEQDGIRLFVATSAHDPEEEVELRLIEGRTYIGLRTHNEWRSVVWGGQEMWVPKEALKPLPLNENPNVEFKHSDLRIEEDEVKPIMFRDRVQSITALIFKAEYHRSPVVVKKVVIPQNNDTDKAVAVAMANKEIDIMAGLVHPHILSLQGWYQGKAGHLFLVTPYAKKTKCDASGIDFLILLMNVDTCHMVTSGIILRQITI